MKDVLNIIRRYRTGVYEEAARNLKIKFFQAALRDHKHPDKEIALDGESRAIDAYARTEILWNDLRAKTKQLNLRTPTIDTDFQLVFFPYKKKFLGIAYTEHDEWYESWCKMPGVREYAYWNNTDKPCDISNNEWSARGRAWDKVLGYGDIPSMCGFTIDIHSPYGPAPIRKQDLVKM